MTRDVETTPTTYRQVRFSAPKGATHLYLVRHGESEPVDPAHPFSLIDGRGNPSLSPLGHAQAARVGERLARLSPSAIYVSNLVRTQQTAAPLARRLQIEPVVDERLTEVFMGEWEGGLYRQKIAERDPLVAALFNEQRFDVVPGGESNESLASRTSAAISTIAAAHVGEVVVVFSHAVAISAMLARATRAAMFSYITADNASISELVVAGEDWSIRSFNDRAHLDGLEESLLS
jgi:probable phosphoglycerate mutase